MTFELAISFGLSAIVLILVYISVKFNFKNPFMEIFFLLLAMIVSLALLSSLIIIAQNNNQTDLANILTALYTVILFIVFFFIVVIFVDLFKSLINVFAGRKQHEGESNM